MLPLSTGCSEDPAFQSRLALLRAPDKIPLDLLPPSSSSHRLVNAVSLFAGQGHFCLATQRRRPEALQTLTEQAGQLCTKEPVLMQMALREMAGKDSSGDGSRQLISPEGAEGLLWASLQPCPLEGKGQGALLPLGL